MRSHSAIEKVRLVTNAGHCEAVWSTSSAQLARPLLLVGGAVELVADPEQDVPAMSKVNDHATRSVQRLTVINITRRSIHPCSRQVLHTLLALLLFFYRSRRLAKECERLVEVD